MKTIFILISLLALQSFAQTNGNVFNFQNRSRWQQLQIPRYGKVVEGIFRGGRPELSDLALIQKQNGIKTIINLETNDGVVKAEYAQAKRLGIQFFAEPMSAFKTPSDAQVQKILNALTNSSLQPLFLHCHHGEDRTGMIIGLYRVFVQKWKPQQAYKEMLDNGFHPQLRELDNYFKRKTGMRFR